MNILVEELEHSFKVRFPYNARAVEKMKTIPGRAFREDMGNSWLVPKSSQRALQRLIDEFSGKLAVQEVQKPYDDSIELTYIKGPPAWVHQTQAIKYIWNVPAVLIDLAMGTGGKSRIIVDYICNKRGIKRVLIFCPHAVVRAWELQFEKYAGCP